MRAAVLVTTLAFGACARCAPAAWWVLGFGFGHLFGFGVARSIWKRP